jgi:hypothetical protein
MEYSYYAEPSIMPLIHPSEEDLRMGAVDYLAENPLGNLTEHSDVVPTSSVNSTLTAKFTEIARTIVPRVLEHVISGVSSEVAKMTDSSVNGHTSTHGNPDITPTVPVDVRVVFTPIAPPQVYIKFKLFTEQCFIYFLYQCYLTKRLKWFNLIRLKGTLC